MIAWIALLQTSESTVNHSSTFAELPRGVGRFESLKVQKNVEASRNPAALNFSDIIS